jgi:hypothetical protein
VKTQANFGNVKRSNEARAHKIARIDSRELRDMNSHINEYIEDARILARMADSRK